MNQYLVTIKLPDYLSDSFLELIPKQRQLINDLMQQGRVLNYSLAADRSYVWTICTGKSVDDIERLLQKMPIIHFVDYEIHELAFHNSVTMLVPEFSLN